ncbi:MAG: hypothetical protein DMF95_12340 [Acidobacteria bacterium]|nr:MAG: hypothetical protein DMF94_01270 [Acidobacteriota bacterium]PYR23766.1 MAG: hypothetical protein DMF98_17710 [Acidobacteriota bacterium]PYR49464.1 MAG: hypothetical protein DMF95_12340 [Acidobacteriota bacterium]
MPVTFLPHAFAREPFKRAGLTLWSPSLQASAERRRDYDDTKTRGRIISTAKAVPYDVGEVPDEDPYVGLESSHDPTRIRT